MKNPTLLTLLKMGCSVEFPSGYRMTGNPKNGYIELSFNLFDYFEPDGLRELNTEGLEASMRDRREFEKRQKSSNKPF